MDENFRQLGMTEAEYAEDAYFFENALSNDPSLEELKRLAREKKQREQKPHRWELDEWDDPSEPCKPDSYYREGLLACGLPESLVEKLIELSNRE